MQRLGGRSVAVGGGDLRVRHEGLDKRLQMRIAEGGDKAGESLPEFVYILRGLGQVVGEVDFGFTELAQLVDRELETVLILVDEALDLQEVILLEGVKD